MLDTFNFVVVDSNQLRSRRTLRALREAHYLSRQHAVVPWSFIYEQTKGPTSRERVSNFLASTAGFSKMPDLLSTAVPTSILAIKERKGMEVTLVSELHTRIIRAAARGDIHSANLERDVDALHRWACDVLDSYRDVTMFRNIIATVSSPGNASARREISSALKNDNRSVLHRVVAESCPPKEIAQQLGLVGYGEHAPYFASFPSISAVRFVAFVLTALEFASRGGLGNMSDDRVRAEAIDLEAATIALFAKDFITADARAKRRYEDMIEACSLIWPGPPWQRRPAPSMLCYTRPFSGLYDDPLPASRALRALATRRLERWRTTAG